MLLLLAFAHPITSAWSTPHRTHPSRRFPGGSGGETPEKGARGLGRHWGTAGGGPGGQRAAAGDGAGTRSFSPALPPPGAISIRNLGPGPAGAAPGQASVVATEREACGILGARGEAPRASQPSLAARPSAAGEMRVAGASAEAKWEPLGRGRGAVRRREGEGGCHTPLFSLESGSGGGRPGKCLFVGPGNIQGLAQGPRN